MKDYWFSPLITKKYVNYFADENTLYYEEDGGKRKYDEMFLQFKKTVDSLFLAEIAAPIPCHWTEIFKNEDEFTYKTIEMFFRDKRRIVFSEIFKSINESLWTVNVQTLSCDQLAVGILYPFTSRMGGSFEDDFAAKGRLRTFVMTLDAKVQAE